MAKKKKKYYFAQEHEDAIVEYAKTDDVKIRSKLYIEYIGPVFDELINNIVYTFKFQELPNITFLREECKVWLMTILDKFDPEKGSKAFAFFTVVIKNWFIAQVKTRKKKLQKEVSYEDIQDIIEQSSILNVNDYEFLREQQEYSNYVKEEIYTWDKGCKQNILGPNDIKVIHAIQDLMDNIESIEIYNKKALYLNIKELTGLNTKQITRSLNKLKPRFEKFNTKWRDGDI